MNRQVSLAQEVAKSTPPISVAGAHILGVHFSDWVLIMTGVYLVFQIIVILPKVYRTIVTRRKK